MMNHMHPRMAHTYAGVDSHKDTHTIVFINCFQEKLGEITIGSAPSEFSTFIKRAKKFLQPNTTFAFGFEDVSAYGRAFVKYLVEKGYLVKHTNASKVAGERAGFNKTDSYDAECAARVLINQFDQLPDANPQDKYWVLSNLVTHRDSITKINIMVKNSLHAILAENYPHYKKFFCLITTDSALAFYETYPSPYLLENTPLEELALFLYQASKGRLSYPKAELILNTVKRDDVQKSKYQETRDFKVRLLVSQVRNNLNLLKAIDDEIEKILEHFEYPLTTMPAINSLTCAKLISEIGDINRFKNAAALAKYAGVAPFTYSSGMTAVQMANERGNRKLNQILYRIALSLVMKRGYDSPPLSPILYEYFQKKISEGKLRNQALKCVQRRLVNIIYGMMKYKRPYTEPEAKQPLKESA